ncbi:MAG: metal-dependent hydrolase [Haloferacaceae archaeon]
MHPLGHAAVAYLAYLGVAAVAGRRLPARSALPPLFLASQAPDLVDKPLAYAGVLPSGRSLGHSLLTVALVLVALVAVARSAGVAAGDNPHRDWDREFLRVGPLAVAVGLVSHLLADAHRALLAGRPDRASFLLWPLASAPAYPNDDVAPWVRLLRIAGGPRDDVQVLLVALAVAAFVGVRLRARARS